MSRNTVRILSLAAAGLGALALTACDLEETSTSSSSTQSVVTVTESSEPLPDTFGNSNGETYTTQVDTADSGSDYSLTQDQAEQVFLQVTENNGVFGPTPDKLAAGYVICDQFDNGATANSFIASVASGNFSADPQFDEMDHAYLAGAAVASICKEHQGVLDMIG